MDEDTQPFGVWEWQPLEEGQTPTPLLIEKATTTPGTPVNPSLPKLWEPLLVKALTTQTPAWPREPAKPLTLRQKVRLWWYRLLDKWPLQWKDRDQGDWD